MVKGADGFKTFGAMRSAYCALPIAPCARFFHLVRFMKTADFVSDKDRVEAWLKSEATSLEQKGVGFSYWFHPDGKGFGVVIVEDDSGEFHLLSDGTVTRHVKKDGDVVLDEHLDVTEFDAFIDLFNDFKSRILDSPPTPSKS
jgi:hypothetical protein